MLKHLIFLIFPNEGSTFQKCSLKKNVYEGINCTEKGRPHFNNLKDTCFIAICSVHDNYTFKFTTPRKPQPLQLLHCPIITCSQTAKTKKKI
jgi:hypothetical protein